MRDSKEILQEIQETMREMGKTNSNAFRGFREFMGASKEDGALSRKVKEIIGVALSVVQQCEWCVTFHVKNAFDAGATKEEIMEACWVAVMLGGGPALMFTRRVIKAIEELSE